MSGLTVCKNCGEMKKCYAKGMCRICYYRQYREEHHNEHIIYQRNWRRENSERSRAISLRCYYAHRSERLVYGRHYREKNQEKRKEDERRYRNENPDYQKNWQHANPDKTAQYARNWCKRNPTKVIARSARYRTRLLNAKGDASADQIMARIAYYGYLCYLCGVPYEAIDHVVPLSKGGSNWPANLRPICNTCNPSKGDKSLGEFITYSKLL